MADDQIPEIEISTRPFLGDLFAGNPTGGNLEPQRDPRTAAPYIQEVPQFRERSRENSHLLAAVTGRPHLHAVQENEPAPMLRSRRNDPPAIVHDSPDLGEIRAEGYLEVDWDLVQRLTRELELDDSGGARPRHTFEVATASAGPETAFERNALVKIKESVNRHAEYLSMSKGSDYAWGEITRAHYVQAIFDTAFRYGRLQQYLRENDVEDLSVVGHDNVMVTKGDGTRHQRPPIADSDDELEEMIATIAQQRGRSFARPAGHIDLDIGGARLSATAKEISEETTLTIRKHNLVDIDLDELVAKNMLTVEMADFLRAAVAANLTILVAGYPGVGKTTFLRALAACLPWEEKLVTIETERELYLNRLRKRHSQVEPLQYIPAQFAGSDAAAAVYSLADCFNKSLRSSAQRILMGEMRGPEAVVVIKVLQAGKGAMSTVHARSADDAIHRFADMLMGEQGLSDDTVPLRQILRSVDLILYLDMLPLPGGKRRRLVSEIAEVRNNDKGEPMAANLFAWDWDRGLYVRPEKEPSPELARALRRHGYDFGAGRVS